MGIALVTGASSGIGLSIVNKLVSMEYTVYGFARDFSKTAFQHERFRPIVCDVTDPGTLEERTKAVLKESGRLDVLVNNAGVGFFGPHETINAAKLEQMVHTNLLAPMILTQLVLRHLRNANGFVINIASTAALNPGRFGCAYAATKAGLHQFGLSLFDEVRKNHVKVVTLYPDMTRTGFYNAADFEPQDDPDCHLTPECVANAVEQALSQRAGTVITQIVIRPQRLEMKKKVTRGQ